MATSQNNHPNVIPIWTPRDSVDVATQFHAEIDNAERGTVDRPRWTSKLFGRSRFRRAKVYDGLAVALLLMLTSALGVILFTLSEGPR